MDPAEAVSALLAVLTSVMTGAFEGAGDSARRLVWQRLKRFLASDEIGAEALEHAEQDPGNQRTLELLAQELLLVANRNPQVRKDLVLLCPQLGAIDASRWHFRDLVLNYHAPAGPPTTTGDSPGPTPTTSDEPPGTTDQHDKTTWDHVTEAFGWTIELLARGVQKVLGPWLRTVRHAWNDTTTTSARVGVALIVVVLVAVDSVLVIPLLVLLVLGVPWRVAITKGGRGAVGAAAGVTMTVLIVAIVAVVPHHDPAHASGPTAQTCAIRRMASGAGGYETLTIPADSPGFDLRFETTAGPITVRPDFEHMACAAVALRELAQLGFYRGRVCDQLTYSLLNCYDAPPKNRDYGFRVSPQDTGSYSTGSGLGNYDTNSPGEGDVLLAVDPQDGWVTGMLSFVCSTDRTALGMQPTVQLGQVTRGINLLNSVADTGTRQDSFFSTPVAVKPLRITAVTVIPWQATPSAGVPTPAGTGNQVGTPAGTHTAPPASHPTIGPPSRTASP
jgi:hypothetical protein